MQTELAAFHGSAEVKAKYLTRLQAHAAADAITQGIGWENGKGCAIGCTLEAYDHARYETELGIPQILAHLEDRIFEGLVNGDAKAFPMRFLSAIPVGADLSLVWPRFAVWLLIDETHGVVRHAKKDSAQFIAIHRVAELYQRTLDGADVSKLEFQDARQQASRAAYAAADAAAADAADAADAAAADAAYAAADAAADAAYAAYAAADAAADAAASSSWKAARAKSYKAQADKLIELLEQAPARAAVSDAKRA